MVAPVTVNQQTWVQKLHLPVRRRQQKLSDVIAIILRCVSELSHNASPLRGKVIASFSYRPLLMEIDFDSHSYRSSLI